MILLALILGTIAVQTVVGLLATRVRATGTRVQI